MSKLYVARAAGETTDSLLQRAASHPSMPAWQREMLLHDVGRRTPWDDALRGVFVLAAP